MRPSTPLLILSACLLSACNCANTSTNSEAGYQTARAQSSLELPPDLINSTDASLVRRATDNGQQVLPTLAGIEIKSSGDNRWLQVQSSADDVWVKLLDYSVKSGLPILTENKRDGILETDWIGDDTSDTLTRRKLRKRLGTLIGRPPVNDKYTIWLEKLSDQSTAVHISHQQLKQFAIEPKRQDDVVETGWTETPGDGFKALILLRRMASFFGGNDLETDNSARVVLVESSPVHIVFSEQGETAFTQVKQAINASAYTIENEAADSNRIVVKQAKESGFLSALTVPKRYAIQLDAVADDQKTRISITTRRGKPVDRDDALPVLYEIAAGLRKNPS